MSCAGESALDSLFMSLRIALLSLATLTPAPSAPDVVLPGTRPVVHTLVLEGDAAGRRLVAAPTRGFGMAEVQLGEPFRFSSKYGTRLWLFDSALELPTRYDAELFRQRGDSLALPSEVSAVPLIHPLGRVRTTLRLSGVAEGEPKLELVDEERLTLWGRPTSEADLIVALLGVAGVGVIALVLLRRRRRRRAAR